MPEKINISEYYSVSCRPYDADGSGAFLLGRARREFFARGSTGGTVRTVENGREVRTRYRLGSKRFHWKKTCGGVTLQEAFAVGGGLYRLVTHDFTGSLLSSHTYGAGLRWLRTAYYDGDPADPATVLRRGENGLFLLRRGDSAETFLEPCPWEPGTAAQSFVNAQTGEPLVVARTDAGDFCFCPAEECALRLDLRSQVKAGVPLRLGGEDGGETLDFHVIPNAPVPGWARPAVRQDENPKSGLACVQAQAAGGEKRAVPAAQREEYSANLEIFISPQDDACPDTGSTPKPSRQTKLPGSTVPSGGACVQAQPASRQTKLPGSTVPNGGACVQAQPAKYAVAAKGLTGGIRGAACRRSQSPGVQSGEDRGPCVPGELLQAPGCSGSIPKLSRQTGLPDFPGQNGGVKQAVPVIPAKRSVVSSMESYLYFGRMLAGLRQGRGRTAMPDGRTAYEGGYSDDMRDGFGVYYYKSGELCYAGEWKRNLRDGLGVAFGAKDGSIFVGNWKNGAATGPGSEFDMGGCLTYTGGWKDGRRHGYGTEYRRGHIWRSGVWRDDVFCSEASPSGLVSL